jgi:thiamine biosynthesis lipoprotein
MTAMLDQVRFDALGTTCVVLVADADALSLAHLAVEHVVDKVDRACSRFRDDSELARVNARAGEDVVVSPWLIGALECALRGSRLTDGLVDPTVGTAMRVIGYDRDFSEVVAGDTRPLTVRVRAVPGWRRIHLDARRSTVRVDPGVELDLGATAKAWCADRAARAAAIRTGAGVVVGLGGDLSCAGTAPLGGWRVLVADDHRTPVDDPHGQTVVIDSGGLASSGTSVRRWERGGRALHHILDPNTGMPAADHWRTVTVAATTCADANIASTASVILGADAPSWLAARGLNARLVAHDGRVTTTGTWPQ